MRRACDGRARHEHATAAATPNKAGRFGGWFSRAKSGIDALPMHLPVRLGNAGMTQTKAAPVRVLGFDQALVWVTVALLALRPGDGLFGLDRAARQPASSRATRRTYFLTRHALFARRSPSSPRCSPSRCRCATWESSRPGSSSSSLLLLVLVLVPASAATSTARAAGSRWAS